MKKYTETHEWIEMNGDIATIGVSDYAIQEIGEVVHVELPQVGKELKAGDVACVLESTKAAIDIVSPLSGHIVAINTALQSQIDKINSSPEQEGWLFQLHTRNTR